jgi:hypothetical protein
MEPGLARGLNLLLRWILLAILAALAGFQAVRIAAVRDAPQGLGAKLWPDHPRVLVRRTMADLGASAARQQAPSQDTLQALAHIARRAPLAPEPFLVEGALAQVAGVDAKAERLFVAARLRDPRSEAARYFLADRYLNTGRTAAALAEVSVLSHLIPGASAQFAPALASFARTPEGRPELRRFLQKSPEFEPAVFQELAKDPRNADLILSLWTGKRSSDAEGAPVWQTTLLASLVEARQYAKAGAAWSRFAGARLSGGIFNPQFRRLSAPPPFNWNVPNTGGVVEPGNGGLQVIYFGRQDVVLAEQLLLLPPGEYELAVGVRGGGRERGSVSWTVRCDQGTQPLLTLPLAGAHAARLSGKFQVQAGCPAQWLRLSGTAAEFARTVEFTMSGLEVRRGGRR